jgi:TolB protein
MDADGGDLVRLTADPADDDIPRWSPDGTRIAFQAVRGENYDIELVEVEGHRRTRLTATPEYDGSFAWSPDGARLVCISGRDGYDAVYLLPLGAGSPVRLTTQASLDPRWSP